MIWSRRPALAVALGLAALVGALTLLFLQIEVTGSGNGPARTCGSAFDAAVDRSGWELWWDQDLVDPAAENRQALLRTSNCPAAANTRLVSASLLAAAGLVVITLALMSGPSSAADEPDSYRRLRTIGTVTAVTGGLLTIAGFMSVVFLVADDDSTLFLYTDRTVVALAGVVVIVPAIALAIGGLALRSVGDLLAARRDT